MSIIGKMVKAFKLMKIIKNQYSSLLSIPEYTEWENALKEYDSISLGLSGSSALDLGCGEHPRNPFSAKHLFGIDIIPNSSGSIKSVDLSLERIPFKDYSFDYVTAHDFLEHVPRVVYAPSRRFAFIELMNEVWRVLKPTGIFLSKTPIYPYSAAFSDPTHVNVITHETFSLYFSGDNPWARMYGFYGHFEVVTQWRSDIYLISVLRKIA
ncbi:MAG: class I SAM-dependent methyltransferase [Chromatiaceae bacterium]|nr:class I SAM-dependent methyltransferase [Chromatiaceae bacterium]